MTDRTKRPDTTAFGGIHLDFPQCRRLSCGIPVWVLDGGNVAVNRVTVYVDGGTLQEARPLQSLFTALMALEGSSSYRSDVIAEKLDYYGVWKSAQAHDAVCELSMSSLNEYYGEVLPVLVDGMAQPTFPDTEFELYKRRYAATYSTMRERVKYLAAVELRRLYYGDHHPLVADVTPEQILQLTTDDLRRFYHDFYHPRNCRIVLAGQVDDAMVARTDRILSSWVGGELRHRDERQWEIRPTGRQRSVVHKPGAVQSAIAIAIRAIGRNHPDYLKLRVLCTVLGGYFGSRLMSNIREEKGYTYGISAFLSGREDDGYVGVNTECDTKYTGRVLDEIVREMKRLRDEPISPDELNKVRQHMLSEQIKVLDTPFSLAGYVASTFLYGVYPEYYNRQIHTIRTVTPDELQSVARRYLAPERMLTAIAGDSSRL